MNRLVNTAYEYDTAPVYSILRPFSRFSPKSYPEVAFSMRGKRNLYDTVLQLLYPNLQKTIRWLHLITKTLCVDFV